MADEIKIDGELYLWSRQPGWGKGDDRIRGAIFGDSKKRFEDGEFIITSAVQRCQGDLLFTKNSVYRLIPEPTTINLIKAGIKSGAA